MSIFSTKNIQHNQKIKLILHVGLRKTGSSALQSFFANNVDELQKQGICYPKSKRIPVKYFFEANKSLLEEQKFKPKEKYTEDTFFLRSGNAAYLLSVYKEHPNFFNDIYEEAIRNKCHTIILSSENILSSGPTTTIKPEALYEVLKQYPQFDTHVIMYVRELYSYFWSSYQQKLKKCEFEYETYNESILSLNLENWIDSPFNNKLRLSNFDMHQNDIFKNFFNKLSIPINMKNLKIPKKINRSLSESEHNLFDILWQNQKSNLAIYIAYVFLFNNADKKSLRYYDPIWADKIYSNNKSTIEKANQLLPENEKLPLYPHQPKGYTTTWNKGYIDAKDIEIILNAFDESEKIANSPYKKQCPKDFNLAAYLAKHFDVFIKNLDPYEHCIK